MVKILAVQTTLTVESNEQLNRDVWRMILTGDCRAISAPGQFINLKLDGLFLRRPISVCDMDEAAGRLTLVYKVVGEGTAQMRDMVPGQTLDLLTGLGNGYNLSVSGEHPLLLGGGVGVPPLYGLAKRLLAAGRQVTAVLGFNTAAEVFYAVGGETFKQYYNYVWSGCFKDVGELPLSLHKAVEAALHLPVRHEVVFRVSLFRALCRV